MARKVNAIHLWREMSHPALLRLAAAAFLLFGALGLVSILIESSIRVFPWPFIIIQAVALGGLPASILLLGRRRWWMILLLTIFWTGIMLLNGSGLSFVFSNREGLRVRLGGPVETTDVHSIPSAGMTLSAKELDLVFVQRGIIGAAVIVLLVAGYSSTTSVIRGEIRKRSRLEAEVRIAQEIQESLLPRAPFDSASGTAYGATVPAGEVGGDYYDVTALPGGRIAAAIADVTGHGVGAGILSAMTKSALRLQLYHSSDPNSVLSHLNRVLYEVTDEKTFVTFAYALVDPSDRTVAVATAGHPPVLYRSAATGQVTPLRSRNLALGMRRDTSFGECLTVAYGADDLLLFYTDGLLEVTNSSGEQFGEKVPQLLSGAGGSPQQIVTRLLEEVRRFAGHRDSFEDDISLLCVRLKGEEFV